MLSNQYETHRLEFPKPLKEITKIWGKRQGRTTSDDRWVKLNEYNVCAVGNAHYNLRPTNQN